MKEKLTHPPEKTTLKKPSLITVKKLNSATMILNIKFLRSSSRRFPFIIQSNNIKTGNVVCSRCSETIATWR